MAAAPTTFDLWTVLDATGRRWLCRCACGAEKLVAASDLRSGKSRNCRSCGLRRRKMKPGDKRIKHGMERSPEYRIWIDMKRRCEQPQRPDYKNYGGRGITVCERWRESFASFHADMGVRPDGMTLERKDNALGYSPDNCEWIPEVRQHRNKRTNRIIEVNGEKMTVADAAEKFGINYYTLHGRLRRMTPERAVSQPVRLHAAKSGRRRAPPPGSEGQEP
jgi:hypothetical protein